jgi:5,10-methylenetetrahydrofolate reductase
MTYGPCGGVSADGSCEVGAFACVFLDRDVVTWNGAAEHAAPSAKDALVVASRSRPLVVADLADRPLDAGSTRTAVAQLGGNVDAVLFGDSGWARVQLSPAYRASVIAAEGMRPWAGLNCRDRNRVALEGELAALADIGAAVHCVTGDHTAIGHRPEARAVFDLDSTELASLARSAGVLVSVAENPVAPPIENRPARLAEKVKAGAQVCFVNHPGSAERTRDFVQAAIDLGLGEVVFLVCVPVVFSEASLRLIKTFTGLALPEGLVEAVEAQGDPWTAGVREAVRFAEAVLDVPGVGGIDLSVAAPPGDEAAAVRACATIAREVRAA